MKFYLVFGQFLIFFGVESYERSYKNKSLQKAFVNISADLSKQNRLVSIVLSKASESAAEFAILTICSGIPHHVATFEKNKR